MQRPIFRRAIFRQPRHFLEASVLSKVGAMLDG